MAGEAAAIASSMKTMQWTMQMLALMNLTDHRYPPSYSVPDNSSYDMVIVGGGSAGLTLASRLSRNPNISVLLIEAGSENPPLESDFTGLFPLLANSKYDWNLTSVNDNYTAQNNVDLGSPVTMGKGTGGTSILDHLYWLHGAPDEYSEWGRAANDSSWNYLSLLKHFYQIENVRDKGVLNCNVTGKYHGTGGPIGLTRQKSPLNIPLYASFAEMGASELEDIAGSVLGVCDTLLKIDGLRQSHAYTYLPPIANRSNLYIARNTTVTKVIIDSNMTATGVECIANGNSVSVYANMEVILTAGAIFTPQIMMLSGIGPKEHLEEMNIEVKVDLPVGTLYDHAAATMVFTLNATNTTEPPTNPYQYPAPMTTGFWDFDGDESRAEYQTMSLIFPKKSSALMQMCLYSFKFTEDFCQLYTAGGDHMLAYVGIANMYPKSHGSVRLNSSDPTDPPLVFLGHYSNNTDLVNTGLYLADFYKILNTTYFRQVGSQFLDLGVCSYLTFGSPEYWQCFTLQSTFSLWNYCGTCAMGSVVDSSLRVYNVTNLRVCDAAAIPSLVRGKIGTSVAVLAERSAAIIERERGLSYSDTQ